MKGTIWKIEEIETQFGTKVYNVVIDFEKIPDLKLGECEVTQK